jgi:hypothetical protein
MTLDDFRESLKETEAPTAPALALLALWWDGKGDWTRAHEAAQSRTNVLRVRGYTPTSIAIAQISEASCLYLKGCNKAPSAATDHARRLQRLQEILDELAALTDWKKL